MTVHYPPHTPPPAFPGISIFLAGSIEMGAAEDWQTRAIALLGDAFDSIYNPRRADWDSSWVQEASNPTFAEQVNWELEQIEEADCVLFYFDPNTKSPITLMELGLCAAAKEDVYVVCPSGFWRRGNVEIVCQRYELHFFDSLEDAVAKIIADVRE